MRGKDRRRTTGKAEPVTNTVRIWFSGTFRQEIVGDDHIDWLCLAMLTELKAGKISGFEIQRAQTRPEYASRVILNENKPDTTKP